VKFVDYMDTDYLGAGFVFRTKDNKILMLQKSNGKWSFPGGHREKGETPIHTAKREAVEEIGTLPKGVITNSISYIKSENKSNCYSFIMEIENEFVPILSNEHKKYKWVDPKTIDELPLAGAVIDLWTDLRRYLI
jgi:8-oxo-dGTP pyrophosphatase MutT (NUDIX family)